VFTGTKNVETPGYILVANSWGTGWGDNGFVKFQWEGEDSQQGGCGVYYYA